MLCRPFAQEPVQRLTRVQDRSHLAGAPELHGPNARPLAMSPFDPLFPAITTAEPGINLPVPLSALKSKANRTPQGLR